MFVVIVVALNKSRDVSLSVFVFQLMRLNNFRTIYSEWSDPTFRSRLEGLANQVLGIVFSLGESA